MLYPVVFTPVYKEMVWGGDRMHALFGRTLPYEHTGESWDITCRPNEMGVIENGPDAGIPFDTWIARDRAGVLGARVMQETRFPLLVKIIDANENLSVQVHPDDAYAHAHGEESGKNEIWYIIEAPEDGHLIIGLNDGVTRETLDEAYANGTVERCLYRLPVRKGDTVNIPAGLVHALTKGVIVAEIQQNSDITYRLYDYNRLGLDGKPRALHVQASLDVADYVGRFPKKTVPGLSLQKDESQLTYTAANRYFSLINYAIHGTLTETADPDAFCVFTCVEGVCHIHAAGMETMLPAGRSALIPAGLGAYTLQGETVLLKSFVPDVEKDFMAPLRDAGYTDADIHTQTAIGPDL